MSSYPACPACSSVRREATQYPEVFTCRKCEAVYGDCYLGDSYAFVLPRWAPADIPSERCRYFDFMTVGSVGIERRHGWYDPVTKLITQTG
jgi:hypothetical protein